MYDSQEALNESFGNLSGWNCTGNCSVGSEGVVVGVNASSFSADGVSTQCQGERFRNGECAGDDDDDEEDEGGNDDDGGSEEPDPDPPKQFEAAELERSVAIPEDAVQVIVSAPVSAFAQESNASVKVAVSLGSDSRTVFELEGADDERVSDYDYVTEVFEYPAGEQLTFWVHKENLSGVNVGSVEVELTRDSDGDDLTNSLEQQGIKTGTGRIYTDPYDADTDGDDIPDGREVAGYIPRYVDGGYFEFESDPTLVDSDHDGLDDYEEQRIWGTEPRNPDTDDDGFEDAADPRPFVEDTPPSVTEIRSDNYKEYVELSVEDEAMVSVEGNPK
jgi:hypothetical protein